MQTTTLVRRNTCSGGDLPWREKTWFHILRFSSLSTSKVYDIFDDEHGGGDRGQYPHVPVLIVGAGPVGLVLSMLLTKLGVKCAVLDKSTEFSQHPQAHFINNRSMELFRKLDGLANEIESLQPPVNLWRKFIYCTSLSGPILGSVDHMRAQDFDKVVSPISVAHFSQYKLAGLLLKKLKILGFSVCDPNYFEDWNRSLEVEKRILMGHECTSIHPNSKGVTVEASFVKEGKLVKRNIHCSILIGSDGSRSMVRELIGIQMNGEKNLQKLISIHFLSRDLGQYLLKERPGMLFFIFNTDGIGVLVAHDLNQGEFVLQIPFYPPQQNIKDFSHKVCEDMIFKLAGYKLGDIDVQDIKPWVMHAEVAEKYISNNGRVILVGDAAHCFPPAGGFGMNTGIQDSHNLAWKIASIFHGISSQSILQTYEMERRPVALFNTSLSIQNFKEAMSIPSALGLDPVVANSVHRVIDSLTGTILPSGLQKLALEGLMTIGRKQLSKIILNENNPIGASRLAKVKNIIDNGRSLQLQFPAEDLGYRYMNGVLLHDLDEIKKIDSTEATHSRRRSREFIPSAKPGSRLPHMNVKPINPLCALSNKDVLSTLDLISGDKLEWLLLIAPRTKSYDLATSIVNMAKYFGVPLKVCVIWAQGSFNNQGDRSNISLESKIDVIDVEEIKNTSMQLSWWEICQMPSDGAILIRPDEHIAWRSNSENTNDHELEKIFSMITGRKF